MTLPLALSIRRAAAEAPRSIALIDEAGAAITFAELADAARRIRLSISPSAAATRCAYLSGSTTAKAVTRLLAAVEAGIPVAPLHARWTAPERARAVASLEPAIDLDRIDTSDAPHPPPAGRRSDSAGASGADRGAGSAVVVFTSGSGGTPKGVRLSAGAIAASAAASSSRIGWREDDRWLVPLPLAHVGGLSVIFRCLIARRAALLLDRFTPERLATAIEAHRATLLSLVPAMLARLLDDLPDWSPPRHLRAVLVGGAAASESLLTRATEHGWPILTTYGATETASQIATLPAGARWHPGSGCGPPLDGVEIEIRGGRIAVRGAILMDGYLDPARDGDPIDADGWLDTGDIGSLDGDGCLHVAGRADDRIVTGGENVDPLEVERALADVGSLDRIAAFAVPDRTWGELVAVALVPRDGSAPNLAGLERRARERLAPFKRPRRFVVCEEIPRNDKGEPDRRELSRRFAIGTRPLPGGR